MYANNRTVIGVIRERVDDAPSPRDPARAARLPDTRARLETRVTRYRALS